MTARTLSEQFRLKRRELGYTQQDLADAFTCQQATISQIERNHLQSATIEKFFAKLVRLSKKPKRSVLYTPHQLAALEQDRNAAWRQYNRLNTLLRHAKQGKPIDYEFPEDA